MNISLAQLEYVIALDKYRNFVAAAEQVHVTQPTLSMQLKKLEETLGILVFDRSKQPLMPTVAGRKVIDQTRTILYEVNRLAQVVNEAKNLIEGELTIGIIPTLSPYLLHLFIGDFTRTYPDVRLVVKEMKTDEMLKNIKADIIDAGIMVTPSKDAAVEEKPLFYEEFYAYIDDVLAHQYKSNHIDIKDLLENKLWILEEGNCFRNQTFNLCGLNQLNYRSQNFSFESGNLQTLLHMVDYEGGATLIPELATTDFSEERREKLKFVGNNHPVREVSLVHSRKFAKIDLIEKLKDKLRQNLPKTILLSKPKNVVDAF